jgi:uncharacterized protein YqjF (DUF2071 family)
MHPLLQHTGHRPISMPRGPWIMKQIWHDLLFAHWAMTPEKIRSLVPLELELDLFAGQAYVAVVPFWMSGIRARFMPPIPWVSRFLELNVRTYVRYQDVPGVYFFSLDAASLPAVWSARAAYGLPYFHAGMSIAASTSSDEKFEYRSQRREGPGSAEFRGRYWPVAPPCQREKGSLEHFLTERYCLYTVHNRDKNVSRAYIHHLPWPLQDAQAEIDLNTMAQAAQIELPAATPLLHFSRKIEVLVWWPEKT